MSDDKAFIFFVDWIIGLFGIWRHIPLCQLIIKSKGLNGTCTKSQSPRDRTVSIIAKKDVGQVDNSRQGSGKKPKGVTPVAIDLRHGVDSRLAASRHLRCNASCKLNSKGRREIVTQNRIDGRHLVKDEIGCICILRQRLAKTSTYPDIPIAMLMLRSSARLSRCRQGTHQHTHHPYRLYQYFLKHHFFVVFRDISCKSNIKNPNFKQKTTIKSKISIKILNFAAEMQYEWLGSSVE